MNVICNIKLSNYEIKLNWEKIEKHRKKAKWWIRKQMSLWEASIRWNSVSSTIEIYMSCKEVKQIIDWNWKLKIQSIKQIKIIKIIA